MSSDSQSNWYVRTVFFVRDAEESLSFYTKKLGFTLNWNHAPEGRAFVFQVSFRGVELIINEAEEWTDARPGDGRIFIGLDDDQVESFQQYVAKRGVETKLIYWGEPTVVIEDLDGNEIFFWLSESERERLKVEIDGAKAVEPRTRKQSTER
jgi:catechol 2,3-dioxygenase-like lactoylglutathione lyase family enzyme